ncbi:MAG: reductive dehalogenase [Dehalococcoides mccartyi]|uniref:reductive dehalogenase n=1 Tax=Dehalococcoides mccartyi TaxID=61435 RepID=UPI0030F82C81
MGKFHSSVSRRDFMKGLGLAGAGLGVAASASPVFHDMDEVMSSGASRKLPWYINEREAENLTVEVDWDKKERYDKRKFTVVSPAEAERRVQIQLDNIKAKWTTPNTGMTAKDYAFFAGSASDAIGAGVPLTKGDATLMYTFGGTTQPGGYNYKQLGLPRWSGTPEENLKMVTAVLRFWGAHDVGAHEINEKTQKVFYSADPAGRPYTFVDVDNASSDSNHACLIPNKAKTVLTWVVPMSRVGQYSAPDGFNILNKVSMGIGYSMGDIIQNRILSFLGALGYLSISRNCGGMNVAHGNLAGLGEHGRTDYLINVDYGANVRYTDFVVTDLPIASTKPIDAGIWKFCQTCKKCAEMCPSGAIPIEGDPSYTIEHPESNGFGLKSYHVNYDNCHPYRGNPGSVVNGGCGICQNVCVFSKMEGGNIHEVIKATVGTTAVFNSFFRQMDDFFGYGEFKEADEFWDIMPDTHGTFLPWGRGNSIPGK